MPRPRLPAALAGLLAATAAAQPPDAVRQRLPVAFLSPAEANGSYDGRAKDLALRPNTELDFYAYVLNRSADDRSGAVTVVLARDPKGEQKLATGTLPAGIKGGATERVPLTAVAPPSVAVPPPAKPGDPPPPPPAGAAVPDTLYLLTTTVTADGAESADPVPVPVKVDAPANYLAPKAQPTFRQMPGGGYELTVTFVGGVTRSGLLEPFRGPPAKVKLDLRPALSPTLDPTAPKAGTFETVVPPGASEVVLSAANLRFKPEPVGRFAVSVDGYERAFVYDFGASGNDATPSGRGFALLDLPRYFVPGKPLPVRVELFQPPPGARPVLEFQRATAGQPQELAGGVPDVRDVAVSLKVGERKELLLTAAVKDLVVPVDTAGVFGERQFRLTSDPPPADADGRPVPPAVAAVTFDATPPVARLTKLPVAQYTATMLAVTADVTDDETPITEVLFFVGDPPGPDGKLPPASDGQPGKLIPVAPARKGVEPIPPGRYAAAFPLPDAKGKVKVGLRATNAAGLVTLVEPVTVLVVDPPPPPKAKEKKERTVGDIKVKVIQGSTPERPQPGLPVELRNAAGAVVATKTTDDKGEATFKDLPPGGYVLSTVKLADYGAKGFAAVTVVADKEATASIEIKR